MRQIKRLNYIGKNINQFPKHQTLYNPPLDNMAMWLDADDMTTLFQDSVLTIPATLNDDPIGGWKDKSGNNRNALQTVGASKPLLKLAYQNGKSAIYFDGSDDMMDFTSLTLGNFTIYVVSRLVSAAGDGTCWLIAGNQRGIYIGGLSAGSSIGSIDAGATNRRSTEAALRPWMTASYNIVTYQNSKIFYNGEEPYSYDYTGISVGFIVSKLCRDTAFAWDYTNIYISEILVYSVQHDATTRAAIEMYLANKWKIQIPGSSYTVPPIGPGVVLTYDDLPRNVYYGYRHWRNFGRVATVYIVSDWIGSALEFLTAAQIIEMDGGGWVMANHTKTHQDLLGKPLLTQETEMSSCDAVLAGLGLSRGNKHLAFPYGGDDANTQIAMTNTGMVTGRDTNHPVYIDPATWNPKDFGLTVYGASTTTFADLQTAVNGGLAIGQYTVILFHGIGAGGDEWGSAYLHDEFLQWLVDNNIPTLTIADLYALTP